jgi:O-antigen ligase
MLNAALIEAVQTLLMVYADYTQIQLQQRNHALGQLLRAGESALWVLILTFYSGAVIGLTFADAAALDLGDSPFARSLWFFTYGAVISLALFHIPRILRLVAFNPLIIICVLWCALTYFWSIEPGVTMRRAVALVISTFAALAFAARYDWNGMVQRFGAVAIILCLVTIYVAVSNPERGIMQEIHVGAWRGPWVEKNQLGGVMTKCVAIALCAFAMRPARGWLWVPLGVVAFGLVLLSTSKTSLLISVACILIFIALRIFRRFPFLRIPVLFGLLAGVAMVIGVLLADPEWALGLIGKDPTLTGRTDIWALLSEAIREKPWLGYGYGVYWNDPLGPSYYVRTALEWPVPTAHNGWFDSWLSAGVVVIALFSTLLVLTIILAFQRIKHGGVETYWVILCLFFFTVFSLSESTILQQNSLSWFLFVATASKLWANERPWWRPGSKPHVAWFGIAKG